MSLPRSRAAGLAVAVVLALAAAAIGVVRLAHASDSARRSPVRASVGPIRLVAAGHELRTLSTARVRALDAAGLRRLLLTLPSFREEQRGNTRVRLSLQRLQALGALEGARRGGGGRVVIPAFPAAANTWLPIVRQALRNNCETAALSMLLVDRGVRVDQLTLQRRLRRSGTRDPVLDADGSIAIWGDPSEGFVGRPEGGGPAGGFGVYQGPIRALARTYGVALEDLSGSPASLVYRRLLAGHPVLVWLGLSEGPFRQWKTASGKTITVNFGEHTVVLTGIDGDRVYVNDPLTGKRVVWSRAQFEQMWRLLGRRALAA